MVAAADSVRAELTKATSSGERASGAEAPVSLLIIRGSQPQEQIPSCPHSLGSYMGGRLRGAPVGQRLRAWAGGPGR